MGRAGKDAVQEAKNTANAALKDFKNQQEIAKASVEKQKEEYKAFDFKNPYAENVYEDLTVNQQQAQFQAQKGDQMRSNILEGLKGAAGSSGIAGLAQAMANQGQLQTQQISASIGMQEAQNQKLKAQGELKTQAGEAMVQQAESGRVATLLGMEYGELTAANAGVQQGYAARQSAAAMELERVNANKAMTGQIIGAVGSVAGGVLTGGLTKGGFLNP
tara:strand:+ start:2433 stop:3086 length:654 start_codon:yes stop_codon:yes gene_type:complete